MVDVERGVPGYAVTAFPIPKELDGTDGWSHEQWQSEFDRTGTNLRTFFASRDPLVVLARTAVRFLIGGGQAKKDLASEVRPLDQAEVEIAQAFVLMTPSPLKAAPTSPGNFVRYWALMSRHIHGFIRKQPKTSDDFDLTEAVRRKARLQTLYYRNLFTKDDCDKTLTGLLERLERQSETALGFRLSVLFRSMVQLSELIEQRFNTFAGNINDLMHSPDRKKILAAIAFFTASYPLAARAWRYGKNRYTNLEDLRNAGFQMSELAWPWVFSLDRPTLEQHFDSKIVDMLYRLSLAPGDLKDQNPEHIYLNNPIWRKPYLRLDNGNLFVALPHLIFSFPFAIMEGVMEGHKALERAYEDARADYLEEAVADLLTKAMPSATIYRGVVWDDPITGKTWENDVVALLGNFVFVLEAKSGQIKDAARRGGDLSLIKNFKELFVEPGEQGWRLQNYLDTQRQNAVLRLKSDGSLLDFKLDRPKVVYRYSVCFEHFTNLTSARYYLKELGLIKNATAWAPVISLGELQMIHRFLDTEISFQHYLTRRSTVDELIDFEGDEQDILSLYFTNGLCLDPAALEGQKVVFLESDAIVRGPKVPRTNRRTPEVLGVQLSPMWTEIVKELYLDANQRHRFDIVDTVLNQLPPALFDFERRVRRFRRGVPLEDNGDTAITRFAVGRRLFVVACHFAKVAPEPDEWQEFGRHIVGMFVDHDQMVECATFLFKRRSKDRTFDGVSFYRYGFGPKPYDLADSLSS
ncbi:hypothetical protein GCM10007301_38190 [Azorhizobium oxalatiphilum]|uniref:NERD domain-containing protein n=1 Tax=Azorhizobium oxalatiphilum TaxID=980631 RepID=A0A917C6Q3_9HYPH|nr:hypothetical protein [Azorhizobium oxalatiphilum]GGF74685.1 hypothetical protein GCM10007301_38190 [Azorhizobium oxalatiphilum]